MSDIRMATIAREVGVEFPAAMTSIGCGFEFRWVQLAAAAGSKHYARVTLGDKYLMLRRRDFATSQQKAWYRAYLGAPAGTPSAPAVVTNLRADSTIASVLTGNFETGTDVTGLTPIIDHPAFGGGAGAGANGNETDEEIIKIYPPGLTFTLEIENATNTAADLYLHLFWWEVSAGFLPPIIEV